VKRLLFLLILFVSVVTPAHAVNEWFDTFDADLMRWQELANFQLHDPEQPCNSSNELRTAWSSMQGKAMLTLEDAEPCFAAVRIQDAFWEPRDYYSVSFLFSFQGKYTQRSWIVRAIDQNNFLALHWENGKVYPEKRLGGQLYGFGHPREVPLAEEEVHFVHLQYFSSQKRLRLFVNHKFISEFYENDIDPQLTSGTPGFGVRHDRPRQYSRTWYDDFTIEPIPTKMILPVFSLFQSDLRWNSAIYDKADFWSPQDSSIENWGCALVSATMVLRFHGIQSMPDGQEVTPLTVNEWLMAQPDGYLGQGHLNWRALTRLSWQVAQTSGGKKLEFSRHEPLPQEKLGWLREQLQLGLPVILEQPGHFVVATGYDTKSSDIYISDPYYYRTTLSDYGNTYLSARLFTPSYTDLSTLTLYAPPNVHLTFRNEYADKIYPRIWFERPLKNEVLGTEIGRGFLIYEFEQPEDFILTVTASQNEVASEAVHILAYTQDGSVTENTWLLTGETDETSLAILYHKQSETEIFTPDAGPLIEQRQLERWLNKNEIHSPFLIEYILEWQNRLLELRSQPHIHANQRLITLLLTTTVKLHWLEPWVAEQILRIFQSIVDSSLPLSAIIQDLCIKDSGQICRAQSSA
jgi:hypothetical protein